MLLAPPFRLLQLHNPEDQTGLLAEEVQAECGKGLITIWECETEDLDLVRKRLATHMSPRPDVEPDGNRASRRTSRGRKKGPGEINRTW
jgi:hypothetical protein